MEEDFFAKMLREARENPPLAEDPVSSMEEQEVPIENSEERFNRKVDEVFALKPELAAIGTREQYSEYLKTLFPESLLHDIVWHGSPFELPNEQFSKDQPVSKQSQNIKSKGFHGFWFAGEKDRVQRYKNEIVPIEVQEKELADYIESHKSDIGKELYTENNEMRGDEVYWSTIKRTKENIQADKDLIGERKFAPQEYPVVLDVRNPKYQDIASHTFEREGHDSFLPEKVFDEKYDGRGYYVAFEPEQIHILGSAADKAGFTNFVAEAKYL